MKNSFARLFVLTTLVSLQANATSLVDGDAAAGKNKAVTCSACHGGEGNSVNPAWPNIAGQNANYIVAQLKAFQPGENDKPALRSDPLMTSMAACRLSDQDIRDLAVYFEGLPAAVNSVADDATVAKAEALYRGGNEENKASACLACHGPTGRGNPAATYPALNGQHADVHGQATTRLCLGREEVGRQDPHHARYRVKPERQRHRSDRLLRTRIEVNEELVLSGGSISARRLRQ